MASEDSADRQLWREIHGMLRGYSEVNRDLVKEVGELRAVSIRQQDQIDSCRATEKELKEHLKEAHAERLARLDKQKDIESRLKAAEDLGFKNAADLARREREETDALKAANLALATEQKEATKYRRGLIASLLTIGSAVLGAVGYVVKLFLDWWNQTK